MFSLAYTFSLLAIVFLILKIYTKVKTSWCKSKVCLIGKTVIVTGANTGIGYEASLEFAKRGARVILACRNEDKANHARDQIVKETENENIVVKLVNMASLSSVRKFAENILQTEERLDILVNNAGVGALRNKVTEDGLQVLMQVNYFGPVLLTILLIDLLKKSSPSRIINVSSVAASRSKLTQGNLNEFGGPFLCYCNSKLCNILFTMKLAKLLKTTNVSVFSLHPGVIYTQIFNSLQGISSIIVGYFAKYFFKTPEEGAQTIIHTALEQGIEVHSGKHFEECAITSTYGTAKDSILMDSIWNETMELLKCREIANNLVS
ncbi:retinol dehydrogenase 11 isoform X1 [Leptinotarsa decemlineata]|uniref:retinol dehydrogenase 11 isoform X1 n=1 Tax=Leptinotarsa decemlineata TaxID=7539 RepID=UPI003D30B1EC